MLFYKERRICIAAIAITMQFIHLNAQVIYVNQNVNGLHDGSSWQNAFQNLHDALRVAQPGNEIWVARGSYSPFIQYVPLPAEDTVNTYFLKSGVKLYGGFLGHESSILERQDSILTTIESSTRNLIYCEGTDTSTLIDGFTFKNGTAELPLFPEFACEDVPNQSICFGGAIYVFSDAANKPSYLTVRHCRFESNTGRYGGAVAANVYSGKGGIKLEDCTFIQNKPGREGDGGAVWLLNGANNGFDTWIKNCVFRDNGGEYGTGALVVISVSNDTISVEDCIFENNHTEWGTGAASVSGGNLENCTFTGNTCGSIFYPVGQGALSVVRSRVNRCKFLYNYGYLGGALNGGFTDVTNCLFYGNHAHLFGGAVLISDNSHLVNNSFINNTSDSTGNAIEFYHGIDTLVNCVFWNNRTPQNSAFLHFTDPENKHAFIDYSFFDAEDFGGVVSGFNPQNMDSLLFGPHIVFGADPQLVDTMNGDCRLRACSPLINRGNRLWSEALHLSNDLEGNDRILNGQVDIGAYETPLLNAFVQTTDASGMSSADGEAHVSASGGIPPYTVFWPDGVSAPDRIDLLPGNYSVTIEDATSCDTILLTTINAASAVVNPEMEGSLILYPTVTAQGIITVKYPALEDNAVFQVFDNHGNLVKHLYGFPQKISIQELPSGLYRAVLHSRNKVFRSGFIKL